VPGLTRSGIAFAIRAAAVCLAVAGDAHGEQLPMRTYGSADGLLSDYVTGLRSDSRGFLWFGAADGVSRFDGERFVTYGRKEGLPAATANDFLDDRRGVLWIATNGAGVVRFDPSQPSSAPMPGRRTLFTPFAVGNEHLSNRVNVLHEDRSGRMWAATDGGLFRSDRPGSSPFVPIALEVPGVPDRQLQILALIADANDDLWLGTSAGVLHYTADGHSVLYVDDTSRGLPLVVSIARDRAGLVWAARHDGLLAVRPLRAPPSDARLHVVRLGHQCEAHPGDDIPLPSAEATSCLYSAASGLAHSDIRAVYLDSSGHLQIGMLGPSVSEYDGRRFRTRLAVKGQYTWVNAFAEDIDGNLWAATAEGAIRIARQGLVAFGPDDGLPARSIIGASEDASGSLYAWTKTGEIYRFDGRRFWRVRLSLPGRLHGSSWGGKNVAVRDSHGDWWIRTRDGVYRVRPGRQARLFTTADGLPGNDVTGVFEDRHGDMWIAAMSVRGEELVRWDRASERIRAFEAATALPRFVEPIAFVQDRAGSVWVGLRSGGLLRYRDGRFRVFGERDGIPGSVGDLYVDRSGRLWGSSHGVIRIDRPGADTLSITRYTTEDGLSSDIVTCFAEDRLGHMYFGTNRGVDRLHLATGVLRHLDPAAGLSGIVLSAMTDHAGNIWFATWRGLLRYSPLEDASPKPPSALIEALQVAGVRYAVSELGTREIGHLTLGPFQNHLQVDFFGLGSSTGGQLRYQYRLEGTQNGWSAPAEQRSVVLAGLAPGSYRFAVRAVTPAGLASTEAAVVSFTILPPLYARWWFIALGAGFVLAGTVALYRFRVAQLLRLERVRSRIATDLHDDVGSGLSRVAILSEVVRQRIGRETAASDVAEPLSRIAETSRELVDTMDDIVWAINPERDTLSDLVYHMRRFTQDMLGASEIELVFRAPDSSDQLTLGPDLRREVFLILKESVTNVAKHARCRRVEVDFAADRHRLHLQIADDGRGFEPSRETDGDGLASMRRRVKALGGRLEVHTAPGRGTVVSLDVDRVGRLALH
jgi:ligand-binding sensor domain-containing protein/signal transduction histidine kinase